MIQYFLLNFLELSDERLMNILDLLSFCLFELFDLVEDMLQSYGDGPLLQRKIQIKLFIVASTHKQYNILYNTVIGALQFHNPAQIAKPFLRIKEVIIFLMRSPTSKQTKQKISRSGNSQFTRAKLDQQYNPTVRFFKHKLMSLNDIAQKDRHQYQAKQESLICDRALSQIKKGVRIKLDWNTKTNFRTTASILPKVKTQPIQLINEKADQKSQTKNNHVIEKKRHQLSRLLFKRQRKLYMLSNRERQQHKIFFGDRENFQAKSRTQQNSHISEKKRDRTEVNNSKLTDIRHLSVEEIQDKILHNSTLKILKEELKNKFHQIRQSFNKKKKNERTSVEKLIQF